MSIVPKSLKKSILKTYNGLLAMALIILVTITISLLANITAPQQAMRRESVITPDLVVVRPLSLDEALDRSLAIGDGRWFGDWGQVA